MNDESPASALPQRSTGAQPGPSAPQAQADPSAPQVQPNVSAPQVRPDPSALEGQPIRVVQAQGVRYTLLGTAHVSRSSAEAVRQLVASGDFDAVAIELDAGRHAAITDPERWAKLDLFKVMREGKVGMVAASLALGAFQARIAEQFGIEPGQEMREAVSAAKSAGLPLLLIDRDIGVTLRRVYRNIPWWQRLSLVGGLGASLLSNEKVSEAEIERLKEGDLLEATFGEFAASSERLYTPLIAERDRYMAAKLQSARGRGETPRHARVLVVIGAGHLAGLASALEGEPTDPQATITALERVPPGSPWPKLIPWLLVAFVVAGFVVGFLRNPNFGLQLLSEWSLITGALAALGAALALAHPLTILASALAAPVTTLHPLLGVGFVAAGLELWLRRPSVGDFSTLRKDVARPRGWWTNRVAHTLLVFFLSSLGASVGFYLAGARLLGRVFGGS